ncbi:hypothetical protein D3C78_1277650 [compost metagenome]
MLGLELAGFELDHHIAAQLEVVEQQVNEEFVAAYIQRYLPPDKRKACAQLQQKLGDVFDQGVFDFAFLRLIAQAEEVKPIRIFQRLAGQVRLHLGQADVEVSDRRATALQQAGFDMDVQHIA